MRNAELIRLRLLKIVGTVALIVAVTKFFPHVAGVILCLILLGGYYGLMWRALKFCNVKFFDTLKDDLLRIFIVAAVSTGFVAVMISSQQLIYFGDLIETYEPTLYCEETVFADPWQSLKDLRHSINHADYNNFLPMLMALPMHIFGRSFLCYALYVWLMFGLPAIFFAAATFKHIFDGAGVKIFSCSALMAIILLLPIVEIPALVGYANISILLPGAIIFAVLLSLRRAEIQREPLILVAILCVLAVFQARTAAYLILGLFAGYAVFVVIEGSRDRALLPDVLNLIQKFFVIGVVGAVVTLPLFFPFIKHALTYDIATAYSAYAQGFDFTTRLFIHASDLGILIYALFVLGLFVGLSNGQLLPHAMFCATWFFAAELLICCVQVIDLQHNYTMILPFAFAIMTLIAFVIERRKICAAIIFVLIFDFCQTFSATLNIPKIFHQPFPELVRRDINELKTLVNDINALTAGTDKKIFILASSPLYNAHTLTKIFLPDNHDALPSLMNTADIDLRDGFPTQLFDADFILVAEPPQLHMRAQDQSVVVKPAEWLLNPSPISRHFKLIDERTFAPDDSTSATLRLYEKISPLERSDIDFAEKIFAELYPNNNELFKARFERYKREHFGE